MSTVGDVITRLLREYLYRPDNRPARGTLETGIDDTETGVVFKAGILTVEEQALLGTNVDIEIGSELMRVEAFDDATRTATVVRGIGGTSKAAHLADVDILLAPPYPRLTVFNAVADAVVQLYPDLWAIKSMELTAGDGPVEVPDKWAVDAVDYRYYLDGMLVKGNVDLLTHYPRSNSGIAAVLSPSGSSGVLTYQAQFPRFAAETDQLAQYGVQESWVKIIMLDVVAALLGTGELDRIRPEFVTESLTLEATRNLSTSSSRNSMLQYRSYLIRQARRALQNKRGISVVMNKVL